MAENAPHHWTDDDDLVDQFVLRRLHPSRMHEYELHLATCRLCKQKVESEQKVIASIRQHGRNALRRRLQINVGEAPLFLLSWQRAATLAAAGIAVVWFGVYTLWLSREGSPHKMDKIDIALQQPPAGAMTGTQIEQDAVKPPERSRESLAAIRKEEPPDITGDARRKPKNALADQYLAGGTKTSEAAGAPPAAAAEIKALESGPTFSAKDSGRDVGSQKTKAFVLAEVAEMDEQISLSKKGSAAPAAKASGVPAIRTEQEAATIHVVLHQRPRSEVAGASTRTAAEQARHLVPASLEVVDQSLHVTLYLDTLLTESEFRAAQTAINPGDSLVVQLSHKRIVMKLPAGLTHR